MNGCSTAGIAARLCGDLELGGYSDWYLPSIDELNKLYINRAAIVGITSNPYWSSTESASDSSKARSFFFNSGGLALDYNKNTPFCVRAVRAF
jgi:hypothetical protein